MGGARAPGGCCGSSEPSGWLRAVLRSTLREGAAAPPRRQRGQRVRGAARTLPCPPAPHGSGPSAEPPPPLSAMRVGALAGRERGARRRRSAGRGRDAAALGFSRDEVCAPRAGARRAFARIDSSCQECRLEGNSGGGK